jgi:hypothetical protein
MRSPTLRKRLKKQDLLVKSLCELFHILDRHPRGIMDLTRGRPSSSLCSSIRESGAPTAFHQYGNLYAKGQNEGDEIVKCFSSSLGRGFWGGQRERWRRQCADCDAINKDCNAIDKACDAIDKACTNAQGGDAARSRINDEFAAIDKAWISNKARVHRRTGKPQVGRDQEG